MTTHKPEVAAFASGWCEGRIEDLIQAYTKANNEAMVQVMVNFKENYEIVSVTLDELLAENQKLQALVNALRDSIIESKL